MSDIESLLQEAYDALWQPSNVDLCERISDALADREKRAQAAQQVAAVAVVEEQLDDNCARVRWVFNPVPEGQELLWDHQGLLTAPTEASKPVQAEAPKIVGTIGHVGTGKTTLIGALATKQAEAPTASNEREAFEAEQIRQVRDYSNGRHAPHLERTGDGYQNPLVHHAWMGWQARAALATQQEAQPQAEQGWKARNQHLESVLQAVGDLAASSRTGPAKAESLQGIEEIVIEALEHRGDRFLPFVPKMVHDIADEICKAVAELPDRNSPEDWPEAMLVTLDELRPIVEQALLFEHEDGRYAVNPDTTGDPGWHRMGPVEVFRPSTNATASNAGERIDLSQWEKARFGYFDQAGRFVEFSGEDNELPNDSSPRWVGGLHDMQLLRAALATQQAEAPTQDEYVGWYCSHCQRGVDGSEVTFHEQHTECGRVITNDRPPALATQQEAQPQAEALRRLTNAVACHLGIGTQTTHLKGFAYSEQVRKELCAAYEAARAAQQATGERG